MSDAIRTETRGELGETYYACNDCNGWCKKGSQIRHSRRCEFKGAQPVEEPPAAVAAESLDEKLGRADVRQAIKQGAISAVLSDDEIAEAARLGRISDSDAQNRDF